MKQPSWIERIGVTWLLFLFLAVFFAWATFFELNQTVRAQGQVMPITRTQVIQAADGGVLEKILVTEGQAVKAGQVLATLERERASAGVDEGRAKVASLTAALTRARAEGKRQTPSFGNLAHDYPDVVAEQEALYLQKKKSLEAELRTWQESLLLAQDELLINEKLAKTGDISRLDLMRAQRQVTELRGRIESTSNKYLQDARQESAKIQEELESQKFKLEERRSVLEHTALVAPMDGVVKSLRINTVGGVLRGGDELMQLSPSDVDLLIEVKITPADIGQLRIGLPVSVKIDAFDYSIYGSLHGKLEYISSDTLTEQAPNGQSMTFYRARVSLPVAEQDNPKLKLADLKPGMTAGVDIQTGARSVLSYLTKPISKAFQGAASER